MIRKKKKGMISHRSRWEKFRKRKLKYLYINMHIKHKESEDDKYTRDELLSKTIFEIEVICDILEIDHSNTEKMYRPPTPPKGKMIYEEYTMKQLPPRIRKMKIEYEYATSLIDKILKYEDEEKGSLKW